MLLNLVAGGIAAVFVYHLAALVFGNAAGLLAAFLWLTYPFFLWLIGNPNTELPFLTFFLGSVICFWSALTSKNPKSRMVYLFSAGSLQAIALLIRPILIGMWIVWGGFWLVWNLKAGKSVFIKTFMEFGIFFIGFVILLIPWEIAIYRQTGDIVPISTAGPVGIRDGLTFGVLSKGYRQSLNLPLDVTSLMEKINSQADDEKFFGTLFSLAIDNPGAFSRLLFLKALRSWYATDSARFENFILPIQVVYLLLILWGFFSAWKTRELPRTYAAFVAVTALYFWLATTSALSILRYMIPAMCLLITLIPASIYNAGIFQLPLLKKTRKY